METIVDAILSSGSAEFSWHDEQYLIQQESNKGCHYLSLWRVIPKAACLCRVCFEVFDGISKETIEELFSQPLPDGHTVRDMVRSSETIRARVEAARERQRQRLAGTGETVNAQLSGQRLRDACRLDAASETMLRAAYTRLNLTARSYDRVLRVARTIADLAGSSGIEAVHLAEALQYRTQI